MKICALADIHYDVNRKNGNRYFAEDLAQYLKELKPDVFIVPGDTAESLEGIIRFFQAVNRAQIEHRIFVPGNHDVWVNGKAEDGSWIKYRNAIPAVCNELDWHYLPGNPLKIENTAFFGSMGWYDYSTANPKWDNLYSYDDYKKKENPEDVRWMDIEYARFNMDDRSVAGQLLNEMETDLKLLGFKNGSEQYICSDSAVESVVFVSHIVPYTDFINFRNDPVWDYFGAFIGNTNIGNFLDRLPRNLRRIAFFGHTHFWKSQKMPSGVEAYCVPLGYPYEYGDTPFADLFKDRIKVVEL